jgi:hypothetical protein
LISIGADINSKNKVIILLLHLACLYIFGIVSVTIDTASGNTSFTCWAMKPYTIDDPRVIASIYLYVFGWISNIFCNAPSSSISLISFLILMSLEFII